MSDHKVKIDQKALTDFYLQYPKVTDLQYKAVVQVITVVLIKHFSKYIMSKEDLTQQALEAICKRAAQQKYDPSFSAYNYTYTTARNELTNYIRKNGREVFVEDYTGMSPSTTQQMSVVVPTYVHKFMDHLTGNIEFESIEITPKEMVNLRFYFLCNQNTRSLQVPDYIKSNPRALEFLYRILTER